MSAPAALTAFDLLLALALVWLGWRLLAADDLYEAVAGFIAFGLLMALAWARLDAPDVALAEAAIGAGLMGALLLAALGEGAGDRRTEDGPQNIPEPLPAALAGALGLALAWALAAPGPKAESGLRGPVHAHLDGSGAGNPVTAVLLNFRGYDTLLEVGVLLLAVAAAWSLGAPRPGGAGGPGERPGPVLLAMVRVQVPLMAMLGAYLLWSGVQAPGGAFQAGVVLGASGVLGALAGVSPPWRLGDGPWRLGLAAGFAAFWAVGAGLLAAGRRFLEFPPAWAGELLFLTEAALALSVAATMVALFAGAAAGREEQP